MRSGRPAFGSSAAQRSLASGRAASAPLACWGFSARSDALRSKLKIEVRIDRALSLQELLAEIVRQREVRERDLEQLGVGADAGAFLGGLDQGLGDPAADDRVLGSADEAGVPRLAHDEIGAGALDGALWGAGPGWVGRAGAISAGPFGLDLGHCWTL